MMISKETTTYDCPAFQERIVIEKRMPKTCDIVIVPYNHNKLQKIHRWNRNDLAAYLWAGRREHAYLIDHHTKLKRKA